MSVLHLLEGPATKALLRKSTQFQYSLNKPVVGIAAAFSIICLGIAGAIYWKTSLDEIQILVAFIAAILAGSYYALKTLYWYSFVKERVIAFTDNVFIVGTKDKVWAIDWTILDVESMGMEKMELSKLGAYFNINVAGEKIKVPLYGAMFYLSDLEVFMGEVLTRLHIDGSQE